MTLVVVDQGESLILQAIINKTAPQDLDLRLFKNNVTPGETDTEATYTEADFTGYAAIALTASSWNITGTAPTSAGYAEQTFTSTTGSQNQNVYGYYITQHTSGKLIWAEAFSDGPYLISNSGDNINVTLALTMA